LWRYRAVYLLKKALESSTASQFGGEVGSVVLFIIKYVFVAKTVAKCIAIMYNIFMV